MAPTFGSVPHASSSAFSTGVPSIHNLIEAAEALAGEFLAAVGEPGGTVCLRCQRGSVSGALGHASTCKIGHILRAIADLRAGGVAEVPAAERAAAAKTLEKAVARVPEDDLASPVAYAAATVCGAQVDFCLDPDVPGSVRRAICNQPLGHAAAHIDTTWAYRWHGDRIARAAEFAAAPVVESDESWEASAAVLRVQAAERRVVCGAKWGFGQDGPGITCDKEVGHDADPRSDHFNSAARFSWPTVALICEEMAAEVGVTR